jgi:hypothetical protein
VRAQILASAVALQHCVSEKNRLFNFIEAKARSGVDACITAAVAWIQRVLKEQLRKQEYNPSEDDVTVLSRECTPACLLCKTFLVRHCELVCRTLDGDNRVGYLRELAVQFVRAFIARLHALNISVFGGMLLSRDVSVLCDALRRFQLPEVPGICQTLRDLAALFQVRPENVRQVLSESSLRNADRSLILPLLQARADYSSARLARALS